MARQDAETSAFDKNDGAELRPPGRDTLDLSAKGEGRIPANLTEDLVLDLALKEVVEQACLATRASGAAIAIKRGDEMICRATTGGNAPPLGSRLDTSEGLSGACVRSWQIQCCHDARTDPRADAQASRRMGVRSAVVYPILGDEEFVGVVEIFSPHPNAFSDRDLRTLEALAGRILRNTELREAIAPTVEDDRPAFPACFAEAETTSQVPVLRSPVRRSWFFFALRFDWFTALAALGVLSITFMMGIVFGSREGLLEVGAHNQGIQTATAAARTSASAGNVGDRLRSAEAKPVESGENEAVDPTVHRANDVTVPAGSLSVYENGREVFRLPLSALEKTGGSRRQTTRLPPNASQIELLRRVEPVYPQEALLRNIEGSVRLRVDIDSAGAVQKIQLMSGDAIFADAAMTAVKEWRFKPRVEDGREVDMGTDVTVRFTLPPK